MSGLIKRRRKEPGERGVALLMVLVLLRNLRDGTVVRCRVGAVMRRRLWRQEQPNHLVVQAVLAGAALVLLWGLRLGAVVWRKQRRQQ